MKNLEGTGTYDELYDTWDAILKSHIEGVMQGVKQEAGVDSVYAWDVVNEDIGYSGSAWTHRSDDDGTNDHTWYSRMNDYMDKAFTYARAADPNTKLFYNDFAQETYAGKQTAIVNML